MAFVDQVQDLTSLTVSDTDELSQFLKDGVIDVTNRWLAMRPQDIELFTRESSISDSQGLNVGGARIISIIREAGADGSSDGSTAWEPCSKISASMQSRAVDSNSLFYASKYNPVYTINSDKTINVYPVPSANNGFKVFYVNEEPRDITNNAALIHSHSDIKYFPNDKVYLVVMYAGIRLIQATMGSNVISLVSVPPDIPALATISFSESNSLSITATDPTAITLTTVNYSAVSATASTVLSSLTAPTYTKPGHPTQVALSGYTSGLSETDPGTFSITAVSPDSPSAPSFTVNTITEGTVSAGSVASVTVGTSTSVATVAIAAPTIHSNTVPSYADQSIPTSRVSFEDFWTAAADTAVEDGNPFGDNDPGIFSITAVVPDVPTITASTVSFSASVPTYSIPTVSLRAAPTIGNLSITASAPGTPSDPTISYSNASVGDAVVVAQDSIAVAQSAIDTAQDAITVGPSDASGVSDTDAPSDATGDTGSAYTTPAITTGTVLTAMANDADVTLGADAEYDNFSQWFNVLGELIEGEEDSELAQVQIGKIQAFIQAFQTEVQSASAAMQATISDAQLATQASIANASNDVATNNASIQSLTQASVANAQNDVNASISKMQNSTNAATAKMQQSTSAATQKMVQSTTAAVQKMQLSSNINLQNAAKTLEASIQDYAQEIALFQGEIAKYQAEVAAEVQAYQQNLAGDIQVWQVERQTDLQEYGSNIQNNLNDFNRTNAAYQAELQVSIQNATLEDAEEAKKLQKYAAEIQDYQAEVDSQVQEYQAKIARYTLEVNTAYTAWAKTEGDNLQQFQIEVQNELNNFNEANAVYQAALQEEVQNLEVASGRVQQQAQIEIQEVLKQADVDMADAQKEADLNLQTSIQNASNALQADIESNAKALEKDIQEYANTLGKYGSEIQAYQAEVSTEVQEYTQKLQQYQLELTTSYQAWAKTESDNLQVFQFDIQNELNEFNKENAAFGYEVQKALADAQATNQIAMQNGIEEARDAIENNNAQVQRFQSMAQHYATQVNEDVQAYTTQLESDVQTMQGTVANNQALLTKYQAETVEYQAEIAAETQEQSVRMQHYQLLYTQLKAEYDQAFMIAAPQQQASPETA